MKMYRDPFTLGNFCIQLNVKVQAIILHPFFIRTKDKGHSSIIITVNLYLNNLKSKINIICEELFR